jgi:deoxyribonuclease-4
VLIHAVYLLNCASEDQEIRDKSLTALTAALQAGDALGAAGVVLHPGSALKGGGRSTRPSPAPPRRSPRRSRSRELRAAPRGHGRRRRHARRSFEELASLIEQAGGGKRLAVCLDSCHLLASGYDVATAEGLAGVVDDFDAIVGLDRLASLHFNDSATPLGSNVDRHAPPGEGHLGREGCAAFLSEPRFEGMPVILEGPGIDGKGIVPEDIALAREMRDEGRAAA